jgi:hypothetical protein
VHTSTRTQSYVLIRTLRSIARHSHILHLFSCFTVCEPRLDASPPWSWPTVGERDALIEGLLLGVGISESAPADVLGYSLGGAILGRMLRRPSFSRMVRRRVLLAPGFLQVLATASSSHSVVWPLLAQVCTQIQMFLQSWNDSASSNISTSVEYNWLTRKTAAQ